MFNVYHKDQEFKEPLDQIYYLLAANGLFQIKKTPFFTASTLVMTPKSGQRLGWLKDHQQQLRFNFSKKLSLKTIKQLVGFFRQVFDKFRGAEAIVIVYWDMINKDFIISVPKQVVGKATLPFYQVGENLPGCIRFGTIHSHGSLSAFHSEVDNKDEINDDGVHITIGTIDVVPSFACSIVCDGQRYTLKPSDIIDVEDEANEFPPEWLKQVKDITPPKKQPSITYHYQGRPGLIGTGKGGSKKP